MSRDSAAVHLGRCEVMLKELVARELIPSDPNVKGTTPIIENVARIYPICAVANDASQGLKSGSQPLGVIRFKMRLRRPIAETVRFFTQRAEVENMKKAVQYNQQSLRAPRRLVSIQIVECKNLTVGYSQLRDIQPFFYYQFYTFDERYSHNALGVNP